MRLSWPPFDGRARLVFTALTHRYEECFSPRREARHGTLRIPDPPDGHPEGPREGLRIAAQRHGPRRLEAREHGPARAPRLLARGRVLVLTEARGLAEPEQREAGKHDIAHGRVDDRVVLFPRE